MNSRNLHLNIDFVGSSGIILSPEQKASLQASLVVLQTNQKFEQVYFWGKVLGVNDDYFIAQGVSGDLFAEKRTLYSMDCVNWGLLTPPTEEMLQKARLMTGRFTGDPSFECQHHEVRKVKVDEENETEEEIITTMKEEDRLAAVITDIDREVRIIPRGAFVRLPTGQVSQNKSFDGLSVTEAGKLCNYLHTRKAENLFQKSILQRANLDKSIDFMDSIEDDLPRGGSWSIQYERGDAVVTIRSLLWLGYIFYHVPETRQYGSVYVGDGCKNIDLPFML
jgi:radial spoke head protein 9